MASLKSRLNRLEIQTNIKKKEKAFFFRQNPGVPGEAEKEFDKKNPNFEGEKLVFSFGTDNLPDHCKDKSNRSGGILS